MAKPIHPEMHNVLYKFAQDRSLVIRSSYKKSKEFLMEKDIFTHSAWRPEEKVIDTGSTRVKSFNALFGGSLLGGDLPNIETATKKEDQPAAENKKPASAAKPKKKNDQ